MEECYIYVCVIAYVGRQNSSVRDIQYTAIIMIIYESEQFL